MGRLRPIIWEMSVHGRYRDRCRYQTMETGVSNTLGLVGDSDDVDLLQDVELAFGIRFADAETIECHTVGDLYAILTSRFDGARDETGRCAMAMTFYRLRQGLSACGVAKGLRPDTPVGDLSTLTVKKLFKQIRAETGLRLPDLMLTIPGTIGFLGLTAGLLGLPVVLAAAAHFWFVPTIAALFGLLMVRIDPGRFPSGCETFGDLTRRIAAMNFGTLVAEGVAPRSKHLWDALVEVLSEHTATPKSEIQLETFLLYSQL